MMQFYFLSVLFNLITGFILLNKNNLVTNESATESSLDENEEETKKITDSKLKHIKEFSSKIINKEVLENKTLIMVVGMLSLFTGIIKFFVVANNGIKVFGDLFPAICGIVGGFTILFNMYLKNGTDRNINSTLNKIFVTYANIIGYACIIIALIHFIFPGALFL